MKNYNRGFSNTVTLIVILLVIIGGGFVYWSINKPVEKTDISKTDDTATVNEQNVPTQTIVQNDPTAGWKLYTNTYHGYSVKYPSNVTVSLVGIGFRNNEWVTNSLEDNLSYVDAWRSSTCVSINDTESSWYIKIARESIGPCGPTGVGSGAKRATEIVVVDGRQIIAEGFVDSDGLGSMFYFSLSSDVHVNYGINKSVNLNEYQEKLNYIHLILTTLNVLPNFVPSPRPNEGRG